MDINARIKSTGEQVVIISSFLGRVEVRHITRDKKAVRGKEIYPTSRMLFKNVEILEK